VWKSHNLIVSTTMSSTYFWRAEDECGNVSFTSQTITVFDETAPTFYNCPADVTVECDQELPAVAEMDGPDGIYAWTTVQVML
jgi:hypothetical protein